MLNEHLTQTTKFGPSKTTLRLVHASLRFYPSRWERSVVEAINPHMGIYIWIGNGCYGLELRVGQYGYGSVGAVSAYDCYIGPFVRWRRKLLKEANKLPMTDTVLIKGKKDFEFKVWEKELSPEDFLKERWSSFA